MENTPESEQSMEQENLPESENLIELVKPEGHQRPADVEKTVEPVKPIAIVAIYTNERNVVDVMRAIPVSFDTQPFPYEDKPGGPRTSVMRYTGEWDPEYDKTLRHMMRTQTIRRFSRSYADKGKRKK